MPKKHALILANTEYRDAKLAPISAPGQGYADLAEAMKDPARGAFSQVETLVNGNLSQILHGLDRFFSRRPADDFLLVYFCGHGLVDQQGEIFLALRDSDRYRLKSTALMAAVLGMNMDLCPSPHKALVLDCRFHAAGNGAGTPPRIQPDKVFAGRGLPKIILSAGDAVETAGRAIAPEDRPSQEFTRVLAECLRPPATVAAKKPFTLIDWWNATLAPFKASGQASAPRLHMVGAAPETILRGMPLQVPEMALSADATSGRAKTDAPAAPVDEEPGEQQWSRLSGIFPLEMIAPELAIPQEPAPENGTGSAILDRGETPPARPDGEAMWDLRVPPALDGERTMMWDRKKLNEAMKESERDLTPRDSFADMRARLIEQEAEEKQHLIEEEEEEALQRERLEQWKSRWENRRDAIEKEEAEKADHKAAKPAWSHLAELQKTIFFDNPTAEGTDETMDPAPKTAGFPTAEGLATIRVSKEEFLEPIRRLQAAEAAASAPVEEPAVETPAALHPAAAPAVDEFADLVGALDDAMPEAAERPAARTLEMETREEAADDIARTEETPAAVSPSITSITIPERAPEAPETVFHPNITVPDAPAGYLDEAPAREATRRPVRAPKRADKTQAATELDVPETGVSLTKRIVWVCMGFIPVFLLVLVYFAVHSGIFSGSHDGASTQEPAAKVMPAEEAVPAPAPAPAPKESPAPAAAPKAVAAAPKAPPTPAPVTPVLPKARPAPLSLRVPAEPAAAKPPQPAPAAVVAAPAEPVAPVLPPAAPKGKAARGAKKARNAADAEFELANPHTDSILSGAVDEALKADAGSLQSIYDRFALGFPGLKGEVTIDLKVDPSGWILEGAVQSSTTAVDLFDQEILRKVLGWKLRPFPGDKPRSVPVPLRFPLPK